MVNRLRSLKKNVSLLLKITFNFKFLSRRKIHKFQGPRNISNNTLSCCYFHIVLREMTQTQTSKNVQSTLIQRKSIHTSASLYGKISFSPTVTVFLVTNASKSISSLTCNGRKVNSIHKIHNNHLN